MNETSVMGILNTENPLGTLEEVLEGILPLCTLPLFIVDTQKPVRKVIHIVRLLLMGEQSEPIPETAAVSEAFMEDKQLYVGTEEGALLLYPMLVWGLERDAARGLPLRARAAQGIYLIDKIASAQLTYKSLGAFSQPTTPPILGDLLRVLEGLVPIEQITLNDGRSFLSAWEERREIILAR